MNRLFTHVQCGSPSNRPWQIVALVAAVFCHMAAATLALPSFAVEFIEIIEDQEEQPEQNMHGFRLEHFGQWVFNEQIDAEGARTNLLERLESESESIQAVCQLSDEQKSTLALAGWGDVQEFFRKYEEARATFKKNIHDQEAFQNIWQEIQPLQNKYRGRMFGEGSLFSKVLKQLLNEKQLAIMQQLKREQCLFQYQAAVRGVISQFDQFAPITHEKRERLLALVNQHTFPPKSIPVSNRSHYLTYYILGQFSEIPGNELRSMFSDAAWKVVQPRIKQGAAMTRQLEKQGLVPDKE